MRKLLVCLSVLGGVLLPDALPADVTFRWDYDAPNAAGFALYCGPSSRAYSARMDVGNADTSRTAPATISVGAPFSSPQPLGLVSAYAFDAGAGSAAADASGNGHHGTLSTGVTWSTQGKFGNALVFNGVGALVTIPDSPGLRLTTGMTLEAWVKPSAVSSAWRDVIFKGDDTYYLEATSTSNRRPAGGGTFGQALGTAALATNIWTHLAVTYDKARLRLYVNGVQVSSVTRTGNIATSANPLQIGGDSIYGQYFQGMIDEVRVYNRALTQAQIQADMNTPVTPIAPDTSAPTVAIAIPTSAATFATDNSKLTLGGTATDDNRVTEVSWAPCF